MKKVISGKGLFVTGLVIAWMALNGCVAPMQAEKVQTSDAAEGPHIVVLKSGDNPFINGPAEEFMANSTEKISVFTMGAETSSRALVAGIEQAKPDLIFALGTRAAKLANRYLENVPVIFTMVMNYERHGFGERDDVTGIAVEMDPAMEFLQYKMVTPQLSKVVAFHGSRAVPGFAARASEKLKMLGIELELVAVDSMGDLQSCAEGALSKADAVWFINDPVVGRKEAFEFIKATSVKLQKPLIASLSEQFAEQGALMTVSVEPKALGAQAASIARQILVDKMAPKDIGIRSPMAGQLTLNLEAAKKIQLSIAPEIMLNINRVIGDKP